MVVVVGHMALYFLSLQQNHKADTTFHTPAVSKHSTEKYTTQLTTHLVEVEMNYY